MLHMNYIAYRISLHSTTSIYTYIITRYIFFPFSVSSALYPLLQFFHFYFHLFPLTPQQLIIISLFSFFFFLLNNFLFYFIRYFSSKFLSLSYLPCPHLSSTFLTFSLLLFFPPSIHIALPLLFCFSSSFFSSTIFPF